MMMRLFDFARRDIWRMRLRDMSRSRSFLIRQLRIFVLTVREFDKDQCMLRASALTFFSGCAGEISRAVSGGKAKSGYFDGAKSG